MQTKRMEHSKMPRAKPLPLVDRIPTNMLVPYYLMSSYLYYKTDKHVYRDGDYDKICKRLYNEWDDVEHWHKELIDKESLTAGTGYQISEYPDRVKFAAEAWYRQYGNY